MALHLQNCICVSESAEGGGKVAPQTFRVPISSQKLPDSVKEMGRSIISSWAMASTCLFMRRGSDPARAVAEQRRKGMRHINSSSKDFFSILAQMKSQCT